MGTGKIIYVYTVLFICIRLLAKMFEIKVGNYALEIYMNCIGSEREEKC